MAGPDERGIYFDSMKLGDPEVGYVCWLDVMGTENQMLRSLPIAANFIFKLQCAVLEAYDEVRPPATVRLYPVMDGVFITSARREPLQRILNQSLCRIAITFLREEKHFHRFLVRGAVAFGPTYHGGDLDDKAAFALSDHRAVKDAILLGLPMAQAVHEEHEAPPFGIAVHSSARAFSPPGEKPFRFIWLDWYNVATPRVDTTRMLAELDAYFAWHLEHHNMTGYHPDRIEHHRQLAREFFTSGG